MGRCEKSRGRVLLVQGPGQATEDLLQRPGMSGQTG